MSSKEYSAWKNEDIAIFLSSTFEDLHDERSAVIEAVEGLQPLAESRGIGLRVIDLRLGVEKDLDHDNTELKNGKTIKVCLEAAEGAKPYFIGLLGSRYGWQPDMSELRDVKPDHFRDKHYSLINEGIAAGKSITEIEMEVGFLEAELEDDTAVLFYQADGDIYTNKISFEDYVERLSSRKDTAGLDTDTLKHMHLNYIEDSSRQQKQAKLVDRIQARDMIKRQPFKSCQQLSEEVRSDLKAYILSHTYAPKSELELYTIQQHGYVTRLLNAYVSRPELENTIMEYLEEDHATSGRPLFITGEKGSGKSSLLAHIHRGVVSWTSGVKVVSHFVEGSGYLQEEIELMYRLISQLSELDGSEFKADEEDDIYSLRLKLSDKLLSMRQKLILIIDGFNLLNEVYPNWLPVNLPGHVKVILSYRQLESTESVDIGTVENDTQQEIIKTIFRNSFGKDDVKPSVMSAVMSLPSEKRASIGYLSSLIREIGLNGTYDTVDSQLQELISGDDLLVNIIVDRFKRYDNLGFRHLVRLLSVTKYGLTRKRLLEQVNKFSTPAIHEVDLEHMIGSIFGYLNESQSRLSWKSKEICSSIARVDEFNHDSYSRAIIIDLQGVERTASENDELMYHIRRLKDTEELTHVLGQTEVFIKNGETIEYKTGLTYLRNQDDGEQRIRLVHKSLFDNLHDLISQPEQAYLLAKRMAYSGDVRALEIMDEMRSNKPSSGLGVGEVDLDLLNNHGFIYEILGQYKVALQKYQECYEVSIQSSGQNIKSIKTLNNRGNAEMSLGLNSKALKTFMKCYDDAVGLYSEKHTESLSALNNLASAYENIGKMKKAIKAFEQCYTLSREILGELHPDTLTTRNNCAYVYEQMGDLERAAEVYEEVIENQSYILGACHPETLTTRLNLGLTYFHMGKVNLAYQIVFECYMKMKEVLRYNHPDTLLAMNNLALIMSELEQYQQAEEMIRECYEMRKETLGSDHEDTMISLFNYAGILLDSDKMYEGYGRMKEYYEVASASDVSAYDNAREAKKILRKLKKYV